jgi:hypothetical protein
MFAYPPFAIPPELDSLRREVRTFLAEVSPRWSGWERGHSWIRYDREFSRELGRRGWIGMTWPKRYGGHERSPFERFVVNEEMLAAGAPMCSHWVADRQSGPLLLRVGTEAQRARVLPLIARGEVSFCIGLSEPDAGSDLASLRSRATKVPGGWRLNGRKIWTTHAHRCEFMIGLFRTGGSAQEEKYKGLSQFLIELSTPGIEVRPIRDLTGEEHFNEIVFEDAFIGDDAIVGKEGEGWAQANAELAFERSGPDRYMSTFPLLPPTVDALQRSGEPDRLSARRIGEAVADLAVLRQMSISIQGMLLGEGRMPAQEAALTKQLGTTFEQHMPEVIRELAEALPAGARDADFDEMLAYMTQGAPTFSLRGGTREILRGIVAKGLGLR